MTRAGKITTLRPYGIARDDSRRIKLVAGPAPLTTIARAAALELLSGGVQALLPMFSFLQLRYLLPFAALSGLILVSSGFAAETLVPVRSPAGFTHPGLLHSAADLQRIHDMVQAGYQPWARGFAAFQAVPQSRLSYVVQGPFKSVAYENGQYEFRRDGSAAYNLAMMWVCTDDARFAAKSLGILRAWAGTLESFDKGDHLSAGMGVSKFATAAEILRYRPGSGWTAVDTAQFTQFLERVKPAVDKPNLFMNQGGYALLGMTAIAVFTDDAAFYRRTLARATVGDGENPQKDPALSKTIWPSGQVVEMGRDQTHPQGGLGTLACIAQTAWIQGEALTGMDLFAAYDQRLRKGYEYLAAHELGYDGEYAPMQPDGKKGYYADFSPQDRGKLTPIFELVYQHYKYRAQAPEAALRYTSEVRDYLMPEGFSEDFPGFGTLLFSQPEAKEPATPLGPPKLLAEAAERTGSSGRIAAANFSATQGVGREYYTDLAGHTELVASNIQENDSAQYDGVDFGTADSKGAQFFLARAGSASPAGCQIDVRLDRADAEPIAGLHVANTGWWSTFETFSAPLKTPITGRHTVFLKFHGGNHVYHFQCNLQWFRCGDAATVAAEQKEAAREQRAAVIEARHYGAAVSGEATRGAEASGKSFAEVRADGTTLSYPSVEFSRGAQAMMFTLAGGAGGKIVARTGDAHGLVFATLEIPANEKAEAWRTVTAPIVSDRPLMGHQMVFLTFQPGGKPMKLAKFQLIPVAAKAP